MARDLTLLPDARKGAPTRSSEQRPVTSRSKEPVSTGPTRASRLLKLVADKIDPPLRSTVQNQSQCILTDGRVQGRCSVLAQPPLCGKRSRHQTPSTALVLSSSSTSLALAHDLLAVGAITGQTAGAPTSGRRTSKARAAQPITLLNIGLMVWLTSQSVWVLVAGCVSIAVLIAIASRVALRAFIPASSATPPSPLPAPS